MTDALNAVSKPGMLDLVPPMWSTLCMQNEMVRDVQGNFSAFFEAMSMLMIYVGVENSMESSKIHGTLRIRLSKFCIASATDGR